MPGLVPGITSLFQSSKNDVDGRAFAVPKGFGPAGGTNPAMTKNDSFSVG
jgi:hypothetical protein